MKYSHQISAFIFCFFILCCRFTPVFSQEVVKLSEIVPINEDGTHTSVNVLMLQKLCNRAKNGNFQKVTIYIIGNSISLTRPAANPHGVQFEVDRLIPLLNAYAQEKRTSLQFDITQSDDGRKNLVFNIPKHIAEGSSGDAPTADGMVGAEMGQICPPPVNCNISDSFN